MLEPTTNFSPKGILSSSPGLLYSATLGKTASALPNPTGVVAKLPAYPIGIRLVLIRSRLLSSCALDVRPGRNPVGVRKLAASFPG